MNITKLFKKESYKKNYMVVRNKIFQDSSICWKSKGIFGYLWSLPNDWNFKERNIAKNATDGHNSLVTGVKELRKHHYLSIKKFRNGHTAWILSDIPMTKPRSENPHEENPTLGNRIDKQSTNSNKVLKQQKRCKSVNSIGDKLAFNFRYYKNQVHMQQLPYDVKELNKLYSSSLLNKAIDTANKNQMNGVKVSYPPKYIAKIASQLKKKTSSNYDDGFVDNSGIDMMAKARKQTKQAVAKMKKEGKI